MAETLTITIKPDGSTTVTVEGMKGRSCLEATRELEERLGETINDTKTTEYYEQSQDVLNRNRT